MSYNTKQLFRNAISNVTKEFASMYSEGEEVPRRKPTNEGNVEIGLPKSKQSNKSLKEELKEAFIEAQSGDYLKAYRDTLNTLSQAQRNRPRFKKIGIGVSRPTMAGKSSFGAIAESDPEKLLKENRARMKDFVISKAYLKT